MSAATDDWSVVPFVDNRPQSEHHTYRITPQRGPYGSVFKEDAMKAAAAPALFKAARSFIDAVERCEADEDKSLIDEITDGMIADFRAAVTKAEGANE